MSEATSQTLLRAYELIEADEHEEARELLEPVLATDPDNADAWWLYAHAVTTPNEAQSALSNLMRIDPDYPGATELNAKVRSQLPERQPAARMVEQRGQTTADREVNATFGRFVRWVALVGVVVAVLIIAFLLLSDTDEDADDGEQPTSAVASIPTLAIVTPMEQETAEAQIVTTEDAQLEAVTEATIPEGVLSAFDTFELAEEPTTVVDDVDGGRTLLIGVCADDASLDLIDSAMERVASASASVDSVDAIGVRVYDCSSGDVINSLAVDLEVAQQFNNQTIDLRSYQSQWRVLG